MNAHLKIIFDNINIDDVVIESPAFIPRKGDEISLAWSGLQLDQDEEPLNEDEIEELYEKLLDVTILVESVIHEFYKSSQSVTIFVYACDDMMQNEFGIERKKSIII